MGTRRAKRRTSGIKRLIFAALASVLVLLVLEGTLRLLGLYVTSAENPSPNKLFYYPMTRAEYPIEEYVTLGVRIFPLQPFPYRIEKPIEPKPKGVFRVLCLGDSSTWGDGVEPEQAFCPVLKTILQPRMPNVRVETINAAFKGYSSFQGRMLFEQYEDLVQPDAVTFYFGANDKVLAPIREDKQWKNVPPWALKLNRTLYLNSYLYRILRNVNFGFVLQRMAHPFDPDKVDATRRTRVRDADYLDNLMWIQQQAEQMGALFYSIPYLFFTEGRLVVITPPFPAGKVHRVIDLLPAFQKAVEAGNELYVDIYHPNQTGHRIIAQLLAAQICRDSPHCSATEPTNAEAP